jgi:hypothetical protein
MEHAIMYMNLASIVVKCNPILSLSSIIPWQDFFTIYEASVYTELEIY